MVLRTIQQVQLQPESYKNLEGTVHWKQTRRQLAADELEYAWMFISL